LLEATFLSDPLRRPESVPPGVARIGDGLIGNQRKFLQQKQHRWDRFQSYRSFNTELEVFTKSYRSFI
jgi:hypothetical protein